MKAVVLAAGKGTRLQPLTEDRPKPLLKVGGKPILTWCFEKLVDLGVSEIIVVVGYRSEKVRDHYGDEFDGTPIRYAYQEEQVGLADALLAAEDFIDDDFLVMHGDNIYDANLEDVVEKMGDVDAAFLVDEVSDEEAKETGVLKISDGEITGIVEKPEKPPSNLVITGFYCFSPSIFDACRLVTPSDRGEYELSDAIDLLIEKGKNVEGVELDGWRININTQEDIKKADEKLRDKR